MDVKKERVKVDSKGATVMKDGAPDVDATYTGGFDTGGKLSSPGSLFTNGFVGVMGEIGAAIALNAGADKLAISGSLKKTSIQSSLNLTADDFAHAMIRGVLLAGPGVKLSDYLSLNVFSSRYFEVSLSDANGGFSLSTSETETFKFKKIELSDLKPKFKLNVQELVDEYNKKWTQPQIEAKIIDLSGSWAWVMPLFDANKKTYQPSEKVQQSPLQREYKYSFSNT